MMTGNKFLLGVTALFLAGWVVFIGFAVRVPGRLEPLPDEDSRGTFPPAASGLALAGQRIYIASGCASCHSQVVRPAWFAPDIQKGVGPRATVPRDLIRFPFAVTGTVRIGPDLANIGLRQLDPNWHHRHLIDPRSLVPWSTMPSFASLYQIRKIDGQPSDEAITGLAGPLAPAPGFEIVPSPGARALVTYLLSLKQNDPLPVPTLAGRKQP